MNEHLHPHTGDETRDLRKLRPLMPILLGVGAVALVVAVALGWGDLPRLGMAYLTGYAAFLTVSLGALFFVIIQHLTRAGWSVVIRRLAEAMAVNTSLMIVLALPLLIGVAAGGIYHWADAEAVRHDALLQQKSAWLNPWFWSARIVIYLATWTAMAWWLWRWSVRQDRTGETEITEKLQRPSGLLVVIYGLTVNFGMFDLLMTVNPHWYSTMFGVHCFAGAFLNFFATTILLFRFFQARGIVTRSVTVEHYHDLGKFMFAFVFFWSYVTYSEWMLIWYGNIPEETVWYAKRGATTDDAWTPGPWGWVALALLAFHCFLPFGFLLGRYFKRKLGWLTFWAVWMTVMHFVDMFWVVMPEADTLEKPGAGIGYSLALALLCWVGVGAIWLGGVIYFASAASLVPVKDPRLPEALAHEVY